ncbi:trafficking protein particle complex subunit 13 isoform X2 [Phoenix dactylifera]|uniref:Trafficking protein particle complex subunit 13 isoform X2 n=1 Tax=Phoenix dactylifera TaxID=42345 RepID=A0A8B9A903_PHODC|nr:trafficking protein particle complex subunit 13 isoform X2 [Phoenix dactylifera]
MSGHYPGGSPTQHSLAFRVMRLCRPSFQAEDAILRLDPSDLLAGEDLFDDPRVSPHLLDRFSPGGGGDFSFRNRFQLQNPIDAMALPGNLILPQSFGAIFLGETFCSYISINNSSNFEARDVVIKAEMQTEKQRILLLDTSKSPVESIRSGGRYDFIVEHDVKELGPHTLVCTALYNDGDSERKYLPQFFKFVVANPLSVRTKVRTVKENTFLEACIENHTKSNLYMDQVDFEPAQHWTATRFEADEHTSEIHSQTRGILRSPVLIRGSPVLIRAGGGIYNYLYQLRPPLQEAGHAKADGGNILGKLQITWRTNLGEPGRLQTQQIHGTPISHKDIDVQVIEVPSVIILERPFLVHLCLTNQTDRTMGPFEIWVSRGITSDEKVVMINGIQKLNLIATRLGVQKISGITVFDVRQKKLYDPLPEMEIFVDTD